MSSVLPQPPGPCAGLPPAGLVPRAALAPAGVTLCSARDRNGRAQALSFRTPLVNSFSGRIFIVGLPECLIAAEGWGEMSLEPRSDDRVPELTARVVRAAFPK